MRILHHKSEIAQLILSDVGLGNHTEAKNLFLRPFFNRSRAVRQRNLAISLGLYAL